MKNLHFLNLLLSTVFLFFSAALYAQTAFEYPLTSNFQAIQTGAPDLIVVPNNSGNTGEFVTRTVPETTCGQTGEAAGYFFEDDAGFQFINPEGFIDQAYSIAFNFQIDEFISPPPWVRIISFTHIDDVGVYIKLTNPPDNGTLEFWPFGSVGEDNFFSPADFYQIILVRNDEGLIKIYVNGSEFAEYDDSSTQTYVPKDPDNFIIWFRDHPSVMANEASPGFVSDVVIGNYAWTPTEIAGTWEDFCSDLLTVEENKLSAIQVYPNPASSIIHIKLPSDQIESIEIIDMYGKTKIRTETKGISAKLDVGKLSTGMYIASVETTDQKRYIRVFHKN